MREKTSEESIVRMIKEMYTITEDGKIRRIMDCSKRDYVSHPEPAEELCQMKIGNMKTRDIAYCFFNGHLPRGRVVYKDGNRRNHKKDNLIVVSVNDYYKAVSVGLMLLAEKKKEENIKINSPKDLKDVLAKKGLDSFGKEEVIKIINGSCLGRMQLSRIKKTIRELEGVKNG